MVCFCSWLSCDRWACTCALCHSSALPTAASSSRPLIINTNNWDHILLPALRARSSCCISRSTSIECLPLPHARIIICHTTTNTAYCCCYSVTGRSFRSGWPRQCKWYIEPVDPDDGHLKTWGGGTWTHSRMPTSFQNQSIVPKIRNVHNPWYRVVP